MTSPASDPKVSIGLPVYNGERFGGNTIDSVLEQACRHDEIAADDDSTDGAADVVGRKED